MASPNKIMSPLMNSRTVQEGFYQPNRGFAQNPLLSPPQMNTMTSFSTTASNLSSASSGRVFSNLGRDLMINKKTGF